MSVGRLRIHLGVGPGVGSTHALLDEATRRHRRGTDVVLAALETRGRPGLEALATGLDDWRGRITPGYAGLVARRPQVVVLDDLTAVSPTGAGLRWQDAKILVNAGIEVIASMDVRGIASLADVVAEVTGERPQRTVPDSFLAAAHLELVDLDPDALRRRLAHGGLYASDELDAVRAARFRPDALAALRELAFRWMTSRVAAASGSAELSERVLVALADSGTGEPLLARAARLSDRIGADLHAVHVLGSGTDDSGLEPLATGLGATYHHVVGEDVALSLAEVARGIRATQIVVGRSPGRRSAGTILRSLLGIRRPGTADRLVEVSEVDVHIVATSADTATEPRLAQRQPTLSASRRLIGFVLAVGLPALVTPVLLLVQHSLSLPGIALSYLLALVLTALVGGIWPALVSGFVATTLLNYFFIPPLHTLAIGEHGNVVSLILLLATGALVGAVVHRAAAAETRAGRSSAEARVLATAAEASLQGTEALPTLLEQVRASFGMTSASLLAASGPVSEEDWRTVASVGPQPPRSPAEADVQAPAGERLVLAVSGRTLSASDQLVLGALAAQTRAVMERDRLARAADAAARLEATERLRDALLVAVGHDLRTPLAAARAAVGSLRSPDVEWTARERAELLATADESLDRLMRLVNDILDLSRLRAGVLSVANEYLWVDEIIPPALGELGPDGDGIVVNAPADLPPVLGDAALLQRVLVNLLGNALRYSPAEAPPVLAVSATADHVELRVIDRGPGIPADQVERVFTPFQRLGDSDHRHGLGLGLALSRGLVEAMNGTLEPQDTPGGGLTMVISLPSQEDQVVAEPGQREREDRW